MNNTDKIEVPGLLTLEWLPEVKDKPDVKEAIANIILSGELETFMRKDGLSENTIQAYRDALK